MDAYAHGMAMAKQQASSLSPLTPNSPFDRLGMAVDDLRTLQKFAEAIADRLTGAVPTDAASKGMEVVGGGGLLEGMECSTTTILGLVSTIRADLQRIEGRI